MLYDILLFGYKLIVYNSMAISHIYSRFTHRFKILTLAFLGNSDTIITLKVYDSAIEFQIVCFYKLLSFLS